MMRTIVFCVFLCLGLLLSSASAQEDFSLIGPHEPITLDNADQVKLLAQLTPIGRVGDFFWTQEGYLVSSKTGEIYLIPTDPYTEYALNLASASAFSPDLSMLALGGADGRVLILDVATLKRLAAFQCGNTDISVTSLTFSPDGKQLAAGALYGLICVWDLANDGWMIETQIREDSGPGVWTPSIISLYFSPQGDALIIIVNFALYFWEFKSGSEVKPSGSHIWPYGVEFNRQQTQFAVFGGQQVVASSAGLIRLYQLDGFKEIRAFGEITTVPVDQAEFVFRTPVEEAHFNPAGTTLTGVSRGAIDIWNLSTWRVLASYSAGDSYYGPTRPDVAFDQSYTRAAFIDLDNTVHIWDMNTGQELATRFSNEDVYGLMFHPNNTLLALRTENGALLWDTTTGSTAPLGQLTQQGRLGYVNTFNSNGTLLTSLDNNYYYNYDFSPYPIFIWGIPNTDG